MLEDFKLLLGIESEDTSKDAMLTLYLSKAQAKFKNYCHRSDVPQNAQSSIVDYAIVIYNRTGSEGLSSESYSGVSNTYETDIPQSIKTEWNSFKKVQFI